MGPQQMNQPDGTFMGCDMRYIVVGPYLYYYVLICLLIYIIYVLYLLLMYSHMISRFSLPTPIRPLVYVCMSVYLCMCV